MISRKTRRLVTGLMLGLVLSSGPLRAEYLLAPSDGVRIKLRDWPDLAGDYTVSAEGTISLPVVGEVKAQGLSAGALSEAIAALIRRHADAADKSVAAVEIIRFRPFFVLGDVQRPGEHVFRPGLTVLQAVTMAGGYYRPTGSTLLRTNREIALANGDIEAHAFRRLKATARAARLEAALAGKEEITFPEELTSRAGEAAIRTMLENERSMLALELRRSAEQVQSLDSIRMLYQREITSLGQQTEALKREQDAVQRQLTELRTLAGRGLALTPNIITLERMVAQTQNEQLGAMTAVARARQNIELAEQKLRDQDAERRRQQAMELQEARSDEADARLRTTASQELIDEALATERVEGRNPGLEIMQRRSVMLVRREGTQTREFPADDAVLVQPDDVLKVMPLPPRRVTTRATPGQAPAN